MAYDDTKWGGFAKIIVDTSTMTVGDTVRVRSMTDSNAVYNKQVVTVGTPIIFETEIYKDYVKICLVQTINDTPTEIGGVYKEVDYGRVLYIDVLDKTTLGGIQGILNAHQESSQLAIGDEVDIIVNGNPWTMQIAGINVYHDHDIMFVSKVMWTVTSVTVAYNVSGSELRGAVQNFYADIDNKDKQYIKQVSRYCYSSAYGQVQYDDYCFVLGNKETVHNAGYGEALNQIQMPLFVTAQNRIKTWQGSAGHWYTADWGTSQQAIDPTGSMMYVTSGCGVVPAFMLIADS